MLVVQAGPRLCALPVDAVREVIRPRAITTIPGAPAVAWGLVNVRGMIVTVLDLAEALRLEEGGVVDPGARAVVPPSIVLLEYGGRAVGVAVDAVHDVRPLDQGRGSSGHDVAEGSGEIGGDEGAGPRIVCGLASAGDDIVTRLDPGALLAQVMLSSEEGP